MRIALNYALKVKSTDAGLRTFGKVGYQTMNPKAGTVVNENLDSVLALWKAGKLKDLEGNTCTIGDGRVPCLDVYATVSLLQDGEIERVDEVRCSAGGTATMPSQAPASDEDEDTPF